MSAWYKQRSHRHSLNVCFLQTSCDLRSQADTNSTIEYTCYGLKNLYRFKACKGISMTWKREAIVENASVFYMFHLTLSCRSRSPMRKSRSRSRSPREWRRGERNRSNDRDRERRRGLREDHRGKVRLYVCNMPYEVSWQTLKDSFKKERKFFSVIFQNSSRYGTCSLII